MPDILRYPAATLAAFASRLLGSAGLERNKAETVAGILVEGDLLGHDTHGLQLLPSYLADLERGGMTREGGPRTIADFPAALTWDGRHLPGAWLVVQALEEACTRAGRLGSATVIIRRSHHIGCLAAYADRVTRRGMMLVMMSSEPTGAVVAPHGGARAVLSANPIAAAWPTSDGAVMVDVSQSISSYGGVRRLAAEGRKLPGPWVIDSSGRVSDDPAVVFADPPGALLPVGGTDHGHKGFGLALLVEALTSGLAGQGRAGGADGWSTSVYVQVLDPALYGGREAFRRETDWVKQACRSVPAVRGGNGVRVPGEHARRRRESQLAEGVALHPSILPALTPWAEKWKVAAPVPLAPPGPSSS